MADKPTFQTWTEITRKIKVYQLAKEEQSNLWECLFLTTSEINELLVDVNLRALPPCVYPLFVFAAHTGCRRSEMLRSVVDDIDLIGRTLTIREKKRVRGRLTTRSVPISALLHKVLEKWLSTHPGRGTTFFLGHSNERREKKQAPGYRPLTHDEAQYYFKRALTETKWSPIRGWHVFRHSFCSNCAATGVDQRIINAWVGHQTEEMVKRYRHLIPDQQLEAISKVFGTT